MAQRLAALLQATASKQQPRLDRLVGEPLRQPSVVDFDRATECATAVPDRRRAAVDDDALSQGGLDHRTMIGGDRRRVVHANASDLRAHSWATLATDQRQADTGAKARIGDTRLVLKRGAQCRRGTVAQGRTGQRALRRLGPAQTPAHLDGLRRRGGRRRCGRRRRGGGGGLSRRSLACTRDQQQSGREQGAEGNPGQRRHR